ncbi:hypothetical protein AOQ84DRAFT_402119 [Glonium stellatum]|uniref:Uncharacterized protein n=1 Tax=Glonium stellatum TaxID=574774 RepID=A0A8E2F5C2_9PEZI|nr:hypothetical protein AOQ84DRAFT_402119 [Glonium stellatum]
MATQSPVRSYVDPNFLNPNGPDAAAVAIYGFAASLSKIIYLVAQYFFIVVAPVFFRATLYAILSVLISVNGRQYVALSPHLVLIILVILATCDIVATIVQIVGAASTEVVESKSKDPPRRAFSFLIFIAIPNAFLWQAWNILRKSVSHGFTVAFVTATLLILLRVCFRLVETVEGFLSKLDTHKLYLGCPEFLPVALAIYLLLFWDPGRCFYRRSAVDLNPQRSDTLRGYRIIVTVGGRCVVV